MDTDVSLTRLNSQFLRSIDSIGKLLTVSVSTRNSWNF